MWLVVWHVASAAAHHVVRPAAWPSAALYRLPCAPPSKDTAEPDPKRMRAEAMAGVSTPAAGSSTNTPPTKAHAADVEAAVDEEVRETGLK